MLGFVAVGAVAVVAGVGVGLTTSTERTFLIGDSFGSDTAIAWCTTVAVVAFLTAHITDLVRRRPGGDRLSGILGGLWVVFLVPAGAVIVALAWFAVDRYTSTPAGTVVRTQPGFLRSEELYYRRDGIVLTLIDRGL